MCIHMCNSYIIKLDSLNRLTPMILFPYLRFSKEFLFEISYADFLVLIFFTNNYSIQAKAMLLIINIIIVM